MARCQSSACCAESAASTASNVEATLACSDPAALVVMLLIQGRRFVGFWLVQRGEQQPADHSQVLVELNLLLPAGRRVLDCPEGVPGQGGRNHRTRQDQGRQARDL